MHPLKLIILAILLYLGYRLITGGGSKKKDENSTRVMGGPSDVADVLVEDPICKKLVPKKQAVCIEHEGNDIYFCGKKCRDTFLTDRGAE